MTSADFAKILIESFSEKTKNSFFENIRLTHHCIVEEFTAGLKDSFDDLNEVINTNDIYEYTNGDNFSIFLTLGTVSLRNFDNTIQFQFEVDGRSIFRSLSKNDLPYLEKSLENYFKYIAVKEKKNPQYSESDKEQLPDNSELLNKLSAYISDIDPKDFSYLLVHKCFKDGVEKANWLKTPADAYRFIDHIGMDRPSFNLCFKLKKQPELLTTHRITVRETGFRTESAINKILDEFLRK